MSRLYTPLVYLILSLIVFCPPISILIMRYYPKEHYNDLIFLNRQFLISFGLLTICYFIPDIDVGFQSSLKQFYFYLFLKSLAFIPSILHSAFMFFAWGLTVEQK